jgi:outer membrane protein TolC
MRNFSIGFLILLLLPTGTRAQEDSSVLSEAEFLAAVLQNHPLSQSADLLNDQARAYLRKARGQFDPKFSANYYAKDYEGKNYYTLPQAEMLFPTLVGADVRMGWVDSRGDYLNPERTYPSDGQVYIGATLPVGRGLFTDERRNHLQKARIYQDLNENERIKALNDLLLDASAAYWKWYKAERSLDIAQQARELTAFRYDQTVESYRQGDLAAVDTLEALIQLQNREIALRESRQEQVNALWYASQFLWDAEQQPLFIRPGSLPEFDSLQFVANFEELSDSTISWHDSLQNHPVLQAASLKIDQIEADIRYWKEQLKPQLDLSYTAIAGRSELRNSGAASFEPANNHILGFKASMPLFITKERGSLQLSKIEQQQMQLDLLTKRQKIYNSIISEVLALDYRKEMLELLGKNTNDYFRLLEAENIKFRTGESSLFLINSRENKYVESLKKLAAMEAESMYQIRLLYWWLGRSYSNATGG